MWLACRQQRRLSTCEIRAQLAGGLNEGRFALAAQFQDVDAVDEQQAWRIGSFYQTLMSGVVVQWLVDPRDAPTGRDLADALRSMLAYFGPPPEAEASTGGSTRG